MINIHNLDYAYSAKNRVFTGLDLRLEEGHIHGLFGCNGMGKTTLLKLLAGLLCPTAGSISVDDREPFKREVAFLSEVMFLPEELSLPHLSVRTYAKITAPFYPRFSAEDFSRHLAALEIDPKQNFAKMSMGLRKRAYMAFALATNTRYLLLDEPTNGLDIPSKSVFRRMIAEALTEDKTILISTHQVKEIESLIDNVVIIDHAGLVINASTEELGCKFAFGKAPEGTTPIYSEQTPQGLLSLSRNVGAESQPDIELLFNATVEHRAEIINTLKN